MSAQSSNQKRIVVVGGGFGGIETALGLLHKKRANTKITLITSIPHFEYTPALYRVVAGASPLETCIPLKDIFGGKDIEIVRDTVIDLDIEEKFVKGVSGSVYAFDYCVLALGSEVAYFDIPGLKELSFGFKSVHQALRLKRHLHEIFDSCREGTSEEKVCACHVLVVGAGATGVELAGELSMYLRRLAKQHNFPPEFITLDLVEAAPRILPTLKEDISKEVTYQLRNLGVNIFLNRTVVKEEVETVFLKDMQMNPARSCEGSQRTYGGSTSIGTTSNGVKTKTLIWAAGIRAHHLYREIRGLTCDEGGRVVVDEFLRAVNAENVYVIGDGASTPYAGMAQTALRDARFVADTIVASLCGRKMREYVPSSVSHIIPVGEGWAVALIGHWRFYGKFAWWLRRIVDLRYFLSILPLRKALLVFREGTSLCESCEVCSSAENNT
ncbi:MAG: NAD(P)/FAD-dependent oxidoreductase [Parcubacteria group bacterium]|nr:NAD(P)/FAD-dependent oxidoreductase [Parcubacteria group bacterium]